MHLLRVRSGLPLRGEIRVPGDKSITHRALLLGALASGRSQVRSALMEGDCLATLGCLHALGVWTDIKGDEGKTELIIEGVGLQGLQRPADALDCRRSGTTMRLLSGILAGQRFPSLLTGDPQLLRRPMRRVVAPLREMGAIIEDTDGCAPLHIVGTALHGIEYTLPVASAQVKSAILLAGLLAEGRTVVHSPCPSRDHTERMLQAMGAPIAYSDLTATVEGVRSLAPVEIGIPGDISSAAFFLVAGAIVPGSDIIVRGVGLNPSRTGILDALRTMGADIIVLDQRRAGCELVGDIRVCASDLRGVEIGGDMIPRLIDEIPILALAATQAHGVTVVRDAGELRVKETDRIEATVTQLRRLGARIEGQEDGLIIEGPTPLFGQKVTGGRDHRIAMMLSIAGLLAAGETSIEDIEYVHDSFPGFVETLRELGGEVS